MPVLLTLIMDYSEINQTILRFYSITIYNQEPVNGNFNDATNAILKTIHSDDEDELDDSTDDEEDDDAMISLTVINYNNFMIIIIRVSLI